jgi:predicted DNA-binding transcriptional regulator YafY
MSHKLGRSTVSSWNGSAKAAEDRYAPAARLLEVKNLLETAGGASLYDIAERFEVSVMTASRYIEALAAAGEPLEEDWAGKRKVWRLMASARRRAITFTTTQMLSLLLSRRVFDFLAGTGFKEDLDEVFANMESQMQRRDFLAVRNFDRKIFDVNEAPPGELKVGDLRR